MKLSEILGWRKKDKIHLLFNGRYSQVALETAMTFCDREIDREALAKIISGAPFPSTRSLNKADHIISNMPNWLKRSEDK